VIYHPFPFFFTSLASVVEMFSLGLIPISYQLMVILWRLPVQADRPTSLGSFP
jgi:hypothetical protein